VKSGHTVQAVTRGKRPLPPGVAPIVADRRDAPAFERAIAAGGAQWDLVVDCIGYDPQDARQDLALFPSRARRLIFISTDFVFDPDRRRFPQNDDNPHFLADASYGAKKRLCELEFLRAETGAMTWTIFRPCHIYGPGSLLGCLPAHGRDADLIPRLRRGEALRLVGGGHFLQQPLFAPDLAELILSAAVNPRAAGRIYPAAGPEMIESREFYRLIAERLGVALNIEELPVADYRAANPEKASFLCHRIYDLRSLREDGLTVPATPVAEGLRAHVESLLA
jgi:nucleoside-diphosphate-sugar epimerase